MCLQLDLLKKTSILAKIKQSRNSNIMLIFDGCTKAFLLHNLKFFMDPFIQLNKLY